MPLSRDDNNMATGAGALQFYFLTRNIFFQSSRDDNGMVTGLIGLILK
jgi:hypothetical protein